MSEEKIKQKNEEKKIREKPIPEYKLKAVKNISDKIQNSKTVLIASIKGLPSSQFHSIKKKLRGKAEIKISKKSIVIRAIDSIDKGSVKNLKKEIKADIALFFSDMDAFELSALLSENKSSTKAKVGDIAPENIKIEPGPTDLMPGPAISELGSVGLKVAVEDGKIAIKEGAVIVKEGEEINENVASVLGKLGIEPMKIGFEPVAAYDSESDKVYVGIKINKEETLEAMKEMISKSLGFAVKRGYVCKETIVYFISKAGAEAKILEKSEAKEEKKEEEKPAEKVKQEPEKEDKEEKVEEKKEEEKKEESSE